MTYLPIAEHGLVGDLHSAALVGSDGTVDWYCPGRFDAPSVFGAILDDERGGAFRIAPEGDGWVTKQLYLPDTAVLITRFLTQDGIVEVQDFMPVDTPRPGRRLVRRIVGVTGQVRVAVAVEPRPDYARARPAIDLVDGGAHVRAGGLELRLTTATPLTRTEQGLESRLVIRAGSTTTFALHTVSGEGVGPGYGEEAAQADLDATVGFWRRWIARSRYQGRWREMVGRSALTLKLLTYAPTGAIVAAPTTSLPEQLGGARNYDYRYCWLRDSSFAVFGLLRLGFAEEANAFVVWVGERLAQGRSRGEGPLQIMYGIDGTPELEEVELTHLEGYMGSAPVRVGNAAADQLQLDTYGELVDSLYLYNKHAEPLSQRTWEAMHGILAWLGENWDRPDEGIWETRSGRQRFTYSRLMSWVAFERALRIARQRGLPAGPDWERHRDDVYRQLWERGFDAGRGAFVQRYGAPVLDASVLLMPMVRFVAPRDGRWLSTMDAIERELVADSLVFRYDPALSPDGFEGDEGTFTMCSFWWAEALARAGRLDAARLAFEKTLTHANHLGLFSEEISPTGQQLGNFPQAFTHLALISAAFTIDRALG